MSRVMVSAVTWFKWLLDGLPRGRTLPVSAWRHRHAALLTVLVAHVVLLPVFGITQGWSLASGIATVAPAAVLGLLATISRLGRTARACCCALGLLSCSAALVILWHGTIEAHFHYFVMTAALALYEEWLVYGLAVGYVVLQHGLMSQVHSNAVFAHPMAMSGGHGAWYWALIHGSFIAALSFANLASWRASESSRQQAADAFAAVRHQADHDPLTKVFNRGRFNADLTNALASRAADQVVGVLFIDVDDFKTVNDSLGHDAGDQLLMRVAERLRSVLRPTDLLGRFGGDEFVICVTAANVDEIGRVADRVGHALAEPLVLHHVHRTVTGSVGVAVADAATASAGQLVREADLAMYVAKSRGKACWEAFDRTPVHASIPEPVPGEVRS